MLIMYGISKQWTLCRHFNLRYIRTSSFSINEHILKRKHKNPNCILDSIYINESRKCQFSYFKTNSHHMIFIRENSTNSFRNNTSNTHTSVTIQHNEEDKLPTKKKSSEVKRLLALAKPEIPTLTGAIFLLAISSTVTMSVPFAIGHVIDLIYAGNPENIKENLNFVTAVLSGVFLTGAFCNFGRVYLINIAGQRITRNLRDNVFSAIMKQDIAFFDKTKTGELVNRLSADSALVSSSITMNISDGLRSTVMGIAGISMMFYMSPELAMVGLGIVPPSAIIAISFGKYLKKFTTKVQDTLAAATQVAEERIANIRTVRSFAQEKLEMQTYRNSIENVLQMTYKENLVRALFFGITGLSGNIIILSVLYYGGTLVTKSALSVGTLSSFLLYAAYVGIAFGGISSFYSEMVRGLGASTRLFQLIDNQPTIPISKEGALTLNQLKGTIEFKNVQFAYPSRTNVTIFKDFSLEVPSGAVVALVGSSGSGKSTLGSLLLRFYDPIQGEISIDGHSLKDLDPAWLRKTIASVSQEPLLFSTTIKENLLYGAVEPDKVTLDELIRICKEANAFDFINSFPDKFDTMVGERGIMLSGGQKQRIAIARAILSNPRILLLDEATSALDAESESLVQEALERLMEDKTVITIAHRLSTIRNADQIAVLHNGYIGEKGTYSELMQIENGIFRKLVERQNIKS